MSEPAQGGVRPDQGGVDFTSEMAAAKASGEAASAAWQGAASAAPGLGALVSVADDRLGNTLRGPGEADLPRHGEGQSTPAPDAPAQTDHARPSYAAPVIGDEDPFIGGQ